MKIIRLFIFILFLIFLGVSCSESSEETIKIGRILPLTGDAASYGESEKKGTILAEKEINNSGGIDGKNLEILFEDDICSVKDGVNAMKKLVNIDKVPAVLGATCSGVTLALAPIANENKVLLLSPLSSAGAITNAGPYVYRVMPSDAFQSRVLADWIYKSGYKNIAMFYINNAWGKGVSEEFVDWFNNQGGKIEISEACKEGDRDFRVQLTKIKNSNSTALFCPTMPKEGGIILKQMKELDLKIPIFGGDAWSVQELLDEAGKAAEGVMYTYPAQFTGEEYQAFATSFKSKYNEEPDVNAAGAFDALKILSNCLRSLIRKGKEITGENLKSEISQIKEYKGATGTTMFDENGDSVAKTFEKMIIKNGQRIKYGIEN